MPAEVTPNLSDYLRRLTREMAAESLHDLTDQQLVEQALDGRDESVFQAIVCRYGTMVYGVCWRILRREHDAEDAFQATFLVLARKLSTVRKQTSLASWLHGVARRIALKAQAQAAVRRRHECEALVSEAVPPDDLSKRELHAVLDAELARLPEKWRLPIILCYLQGRTQDEAADHLGVSKGTLRNRLEEARRAMAGRLTRRGMAWSAVLSGVLLSDCIALAASVPGLFASTVEAAVGVLGGKPLAKAVSARAASLTEGALKAMLVTKLKNATAVLLVLALVGGMVAGVTLMTPKAAATKLVERTADEPDKPIAPSRFFKGEYKFRSLSFSRDGKALATITQDADSEPGDIRAKNAVRLWDVQSGSVKRTLAEDQVKDRSYCTYAGVGLSPDGKTVAAPVGGTYEGENAFNWLVLWDAETGKIRHKLKHLLEVRALGFSPDGKLVASGTGMGGAESDYDTVLVWDVKTGQLLRTLKTRDLEGVKVVFAPDSKLLAAVLDPVLDHSKASAEVVLWDAVEGKASRTLPDSEGIEVIAFTPDGKTLLGAGQTKLLVWDVATGKTTQKSDRKKIEARSILAFSPDGKTLAATDKHDVALYDVKSAKRTKTLAGGEGFIWSLSFSPDGNTLAGGSSDQTIYLWDFDREPNAKK